MFNNTREEVLEKLKNFLESKWLIAILGFFTVFSWVLKLHFFSYITLLVFVMLILISNASFISVASLFFLFIGGDQNKNFNLKSTGFIIIIILLIPTMLLLIKNLVTNGRKYLLKIKNDWHIYSLLILLFVMLISIMNSPVKGVSLGYCVYFCFNIIVALMIICSVDLTEENKDKVIFSVLVIIWTIAIEVLFKFISIRDHKIWDIINGKELHLEWAMSNHYIVIINIGVILAFYSYIKAEIVYKKVFSLLSIFIGLILNVLVVCRGAYLGFVPILPLMIIAYVYYTKNWKREIPYLVCSTLTIATCVAICLKTNVLDEVVKQLLNKGTNSTGRFDIYKYALEKFKENYLLGTGAGSSRYFLQKILGLEVYNYHNSFIQIASTCGIIGLIAFLLYLGVVLFRIKGLNMFNFFVLIVFVYFFTHGLVDTLFFNRKLMPFLTVLIAMIPKKEVKIFSLEENV